MPEASRSTSMVAPIYETTDYDKFQISKLNRPVETARVEYWKRTLSKQNLLCDNPFLVDESFNLIDGQHRLFAAKELGLPVYYKIAAKAQVSDAPAINSQNRAWTHGDYLSAWCNAGNPHYLKLREVTELYPFITIQQAARFMWRRSFQGFADTLREGRFVVHDAEYVHIVARCAIDFGRHFPSWKDHVFINAVANLCDNHAYDHARMMRKMELVGARLKRCVTAEEYIEIMSGIYNYKTKADAFTPLRVMRAKEQGRRSASALPRN